jgi:hypothetical protein
MLVLEFQKSTGTVRKITNRLLQSFVFVAITIAVAQSADAAAVRTGLFRANTLSANDDGSTSSVGIGFDANFFGVNYNQLFVNNNGNVTFNSRLSTFTPFGIVNASTPIIAPFFADVDTRGSGSGLVSYGNGIVDGRNAFGVNWPAVGYFPVAVNRLNTFQLILVDRSDISSGDFDIEFNYDQIQWETGGASGGSGGLGGSSARAGYSNGAGTSFELAGSGVNGAFLDNGPNSLIANRLNSNIDGRYLFSVRGGSVISPNPDAIPTPALLPALMGISAAAWRKRKQKATEAIC